MKSIEQIFNEFAALTDSFLDNLLPGETEAPSSLHQAMRWSVFAGGKRFRPALLLAVGTAFNYDRERMLSTAAAVEMLHTYSLIHDDLPSMDDDDLRRGRATCHVKFGESTAILAGDALQALAFETIANDISLDAQTRLDLLSGLGSAAAKMVAGQQLDLDAERKKVSLSDLENIHRYKTGALITFSAVSGAKIANATTAEIEIVKEYGEKIGLLFQVVDDILDITETTETLGKTAGKDLTTGKSTYPSILGITEANKTAEALCSEAIELAEQLPDNERMLSKIAEYLLNRRS